MPPASFRFHLTMNTLAFGYVIPAIRAYSGLAPVRQCSCRAYNEKRCINNVDTPLSCSVGGDGFEPPKASPADLQSAPFGHSGNHPIAFVLKASAKVQINFDTTASLLNFF